MHHRSNAAGVSTRAPNVAGLRWEPPRETPPGRVYRSGRRTRPRSSLSIRDRESCRVGGWRPRPLSGRPATRARRTWRCPPAPGASRIPGPGPRRIGAREGSRNDGELGINRRRTRAPFSTSNGASVVAGGVIAAPVAVLSHELGHFLTYWALGLPGATLHYSSASCSDSSTFHRFVLSGDIAAEAELAPLWKGAAGLGMGATAGTHHNQPISGQQRSTLRSGISCLKNGETLSRPC